jgi:hypothetical protein
VATPEIVHACPPLGPAVTTCCGRTPFDLPRTDRLTNDPAAVTCGAGIPTAAEAQQPAPEQQRARYGAAIRPNMLLGLQDADLSGTGGTQRINEWADWIADTLATVRDEEMDRLRAELDRAAQEWQDGPEIVLLRAENERLRAELGQARGATGQDTTTPADGELPPPEGPEYMPCVCGHIEPEHRLQRPGWTREACRECDCVDYRTVPADDEQETRQQLTAALRKAAYYCEGCGLSERDCMDAHPIQVGMWQHGVVADLSGPVEDIATAVLPVVRAAVAAGVRRALEAHGAATLHRAWREAADIAETVGMRLHSEGDDTRASGAYDVMAALRPMAEGARPPECEHGYRDAVNAPLADSTIEAINEGLEAGDAPRRKIPAPEQVPVCGDSQHRHTGPCEVYAREGAPAPKQDGPA